MSQIQLQKETLAQVLSCGYCRIFKNSFFTENLWWLLLRLVIKNYVSSFSSNKLKQLVYIIFKQVTLGSFNI